MGLTIVPDLTMTFCWDCMVRKMQRNYVSTYRIYIRLYSTDKSRIRSSSLKHPIIPLQQRWLLLSEFQVKNSGRLCPAPMPVPSCHFSFLVLLALPWAFALQSTHLFSLCSMASSHKPQLEANITNISSAHILDTRIGVGDSRGLRHSYCPQTSHSLEGKYTLSPYLDFEIFRPAAQCLQLISVISLKKRSQVNSA